MLPAADMEHNVPGPGDDSIDPYFNFIDIGSAVSPSQQDNCFNFLDDFITSTENENEESAADPEDSGGGVAGTVTAELVQQQTISIQQMAVQQQAVQQQTVVQQQLVQNAVLQPQLPSLGNVIMAMGQPPPQPSHATPSLVSATASQAQLLHNQANLLQSLSTQHGGSPFIIKTSSGTPIQLAPTSVTQSTATMSAAQQQLLASASPLVSSSMLPNHRSSPLLARSLTPSQTLSSQAHTMAQPQVGLPATAASNINLLQLQQTQQLPQQVPLSNFVSNQPGLQGHAVLTAQGSNIVHTQNALIQNPNVVNVNVAHVLPNQIPQLQGTILQTPQGKYLIQPAASNQQLNLSTLSSLSQMTAGQSVQMAGGQPVQMSGGQAVQLAPSMGLGQPTVLAQQQANVALSNNSGVGQQQPSYNLINLGGSQGQILVQRMPTSNASVGATPQHTPIFLRTVGGQQHIVQQSTLQSSTNQMPQQLGVQSGSGQNIPLQQLLAGAGAQQLRLVGQPATAPAPAATTPTPSNILLQPIAQGNQVRLVSHQTPTQKKALLPQKKTNCKPSARQAGNKGNTVTLNLGQNLRVQQLQGLQQQQQQMAVQQLAGSSSPSLQQNVLHNTQQVLTQASAKKTKNKLAASSVTASPSPDLNIVSAAPSDEIVPDNILSAALMSSGILDDDSMFKAMNGNDFSDLSAPQVLEAAPSPVPTPPQPPPSVSLKCKGKAKKKKKETPVQPVVLSSTSAKANITISTASATVVTTTLSQSSAAVGGQAVTANAYPFSCQASVTVSTPSVVMSVAAQPLIGTPAVAHPGMTTTPNCVSVGRGRGPKTTIGLESLSQQDRRELQEILTNANMLRAKPSLDETEKIVLQQLDARRKKILTVAHTQAMAAIKQQQLQQQLQQQQQQLQQQQQAALEQQLALQQSAQDRDWSQQQQQPALVGQPQTSHTPLQPEVKPVLGTPSTPVLQIQTGSTKLKVPKLEPGQTPDTKPVLVAGKGVQNSTELVTSHTSQAMTYHTADGKVIMTMTHPGSGSQAASSQVRIQIGQKPQPAPTSVPVTVPSVTTTAAQPVPGPSQAKSVMAPTASASSITSNTPITLHTSAPRPVQIKIAQQVLRLQLTPQQQEKLELHLSRMTLEQQRAFLHTQHEILHKLQLRADPSRATHPQVESESGVRSQPDVSSIGEGPASSSLQSPACKATSIQQLPGPEQTLESTPTKTEKKEMGTETAPPAASPVHASPIKTADLPSTAAVMIHSQLGKDKEHALCPDKKTPFKDNREACRRLMRFHVFQSYGPKQEDFDQFDEDYEVMCQQLVEKKNAMFSKFRHLMMEDSMRHYATSEQVLISRMWSNEMTVLLRDEKQQAEKEPDSFEPMPLNYLEKDLTQPEPEESEDQWCLHKESDADDDDASEGDKPEADPDSDGEFTDVYPPEEGPGYKHQDRDFQDSASPSPSYRHLAGLGRQYYAEQVKSRQHFGGGGEVDSEQFADEVDSEQFGEDPACSPDCKLNDPNVSLSPVAEPSSSPPEVSPVKDSSSPPREEQSSFESSHSSPPRPDPPPRTLVKLVIRNDGKGFTSKVVERRRSSVQPERRTLRTRSQSGNEKQEVKKECKKLVVTEEIEYIDVDNSKYNKGVSVTLERLSERTTQVYGVSVCSKGSAGGGGTAASSRTCDCAGDSVSLESKAAENGSKSISVKSSCGRKRRHRDSDLHTEDGVHKRRDRHYSGVSVSSCDEKGDAPFREFYVGSAMESLDHFDSDDDCGPVRGGGDNNPERGGHGVSLTGAMCSSPLHSNSLSHGGREDSVGEQRPPLNSRLHDWEPGRASARHQDSSHPHSTHKRRNNVCVQPETGAGDCPISPIVDPHPAGQMQASGEFSGSWDQEQESSFELDHLDPQNKMMNDQMQSAIDSILNGSGSSESGGRHQPGSAGMTRHCSKEWVQRKAGERQRVSVTGRTSASEPGP